jgi:hypothetical protein
MPNKVYLGDAVYAEFDQFGCLVLTTENGIQTTNTIFLEPGVLAGLLEWLKGLER